MQITSNLKMKNSKTTWFQTMTLYETLQTEYLTEKLKTGNWSCEYEMQLCANHSTFFTWILMTGLICFWSTIPRNIWILVKSTHWVPKGCRVGFVSNINANFSFLWIVNVFYDNCIINGKYMTFLVFPILTKMWKWRFGVPNLIKFLWNYIDEITILEAM